ncbi:MAG: DNA mismatch repair protein MutS, partial [Fimbriimonadaceae bacterium]|nr:DNA mismatch repair protein MutS [Alphaproteobacteria bacterium]
GQHGQKLMDPPLNETFIHRQTMANATRFTTTELGELESRIAAAADRALALEMEIFEDLRAVVLGEDEAIKAAADGLAALDVHTALAALASEAAYARPKIDLSNAFHIVGGRHPVVEEALRRSGEAFVANDCDLGFRGDETADGQDDQKGAIWLVTGPNMAGKSTFLRQNAVIAILAQMGSFVPAQSAEIGIVDRLFSRVGASDDLARGRSTFMVEMVETAAILNQAGPRSLVILDEIGRGTATFDGLSIAWATIEHLHEVNGARALFATHYHELTGLTAKLVRLQNATMKVKEWKGEVVFLHEVVAGTSDRSYGIQVAKLAGLPAPVIARAGEVLKMLESSDTARAGARLADDLPLFSARIPAPQIAAIDPVSQQVIEKIANLVADELTPRQALELIYSLKADLNAGN